MHNTPEPNEVPEAVSTSIPAVFQYDDTTHPADVIDTLLLADFVTGRHQWSQTVQLARVLPDSPLTAPGARLLRTAVDNRRRSRLLAGDGWRARVIIWKSRDVYVTITAASEEVGRAALDRIIAGAVEADAPGSGRIGFWHQSRNGGSLRYERSIGAPEWALIRGNYNATARTAFDALMTTTPERLFGRLILLHGAPGTGKTTALRALVHEWRDWCQVDTVLDPDLLFANSAYLSDVLLGDEGEDDEKPVGRRWRLLILEDCDELIRGEAKQAAGQAMSRLLNLTDGLLGQGREVLVAITTNEDLSGLHPAVTRPGRCLARIEVGPLSYEEATDWLGASAEVPPEGATLAELYALRAGVPVAPDVPAPIGGYL